MRLILFVSLVMLSLQSFAGGNAELLKFFNKVGAHGASNITEDGPYHSQLGGGWDGGSLSYRTPIDEQRIGLDIDAPSFKASCGQLDLHLGGINFVNGSGFKNLYNAVKGNAVEIATSNIIKALTGTDTGQQILSYIKMAQDAAATSMNSCRLAQLAVDSVTDAAKTQMEKVCINNKGDSDFLTALKVCSNKEIKELAKGSKFLNYNVTWEAIGKGPMLKAEDQYTRQSVLSMLGTVIIENGIPKTYKPLSSSFKALLHGGIADTYSCVSSSACLTMASGKIMYPFEKSIVGEIHKNLKSINQKIVTDESLSKFEIGIVETTELPILKLLTVYSAYNRGLTFDIPKEYSAVIAMGILRIFIQAVIDESEIVAQTIDVSKEVQKDIKTLAKRSESILTEVLKEQQNLFGTAEEIKDRTKILENKLYERWAKQMRI